MNEEEWLRLIENRSRRAPPLPPLPLALTGAGVALRRQKAADAPFLRRLYGHQRALELALAPWSEADKERFLDEQFRLQTAHYARNHLRADRLIVARAAPPRAEAAIGRLYVDRSGAPWELLEIQLMPAEQARGLGAALLRWLMGAATAAGGEGIGLHVTIDNPRAEALYGRLGFHAGPGGSATHRRMVWRPCPGAHG